MFGYSKYRSSREVVIVVVIVSGKDSNFLCVFKPNSM